MLFIISILISLSFSVSCNQAIRKYPGVFYCLTALAGVTAIVFTWFSVPLSPFVSAWVLLLFARGGLAGAFFVLVMLTGALPNGSAAMKCLMPIRGQLSIMASLLTLAHNIAYGKVYFVKLFTNAGEMPVNQLLAAVCSLIMLVIMLPLFVTSFWCVRKRMNGKTWKKIQRLAYIFYGLLYCHILLLTMPYALQGHSGYLCTAFIYSTVFLSYAVCRIIKAIYKRKRCLNLVAKAQLIALLCCIFIMCAVFAGVLCMTANKTVAEASIPDVPQQYADGVYQGSSMGNNGKIHVSVTVENGAILSVTIDSHHEDEPYFTDATQVIDWIIAANGSDVDTVSGATWSSGGILDAVAHALEDAKP